jgi:Domain of unknown function (DUF4116)
MNNDAMIRASEGPQMIRDAKQLEQELQAMQRKLGQLRRKLLLSSIEHCSLGDSRLLEIWQKLKPEEQTDKEIIYKFLACYWCSNNTLFGSNPWSKHTWELGEVKLPQTVLSDPQAVVAFMANKRSHGSDNDSLSVPPILRDNKDAMMAFCAKYPGSFKQASDRLRDDESFVQAVLLDADTRHLTIRHASQRLLLDKNMWDYAETKGYHCTVGFTGSWLNSLNVEEMDISDQKEIAVSALRCISRSSADDSDHSDHINSMQLDFELMQFLANLEPELLDDPVFMLPFVEYDWKALQWCSRRLRSNMWHMGVVRAAVSKNINAYQYVEGPILEHYQCKRGVDVVLGELKQGLDFANVPKDLLANRNVVKAAWRSGTNDEFRCPWDIPDSLKKDKGFILELIATPCRDVQFKECFYWGLPEQLKTDVDVAKALLRAGFPHRVDILANAPSLLQSREAMMDAVAVSEGLYRDDLSQGDDNELFSKLVARCPFHIRNDEEFILRAFKAEESSFEHASRRLRSSRRFMHRLMKVSKGSYQFITYTTATFQAKHLNFILEVIKHAYCQIPHSSLGDLDAAIWSNKQVVLACLKKEWSIMECIRLSDPNSPLFSDKKVMSRAVKNCPDDFKYASMNLREDREFILKLVAETTYRVLYHAAARMKRDTEILLWAVAQDNSSGIVSDFFHGFELGNDFEYLCAFAAGIRSAIATHHSFTELLRGIHLCPPSHPLSMLNHDSETGIALKKKIAEYADVGLPMDSRLRTLKAALANMEKLGY